LTAVVGGLMMASPASAVLTTFASASPINSTRDFSFAENLTGFGGTFTANEVPMTFKWLLTDGGSPIANESATFSFNASTSTQANQISNIFEQGGIAGSFNFALVGSATINGVTYGAGTTLLHAEFTGATLLGRIGGSSGGLDDSAGPLQMTGGTITYTSQVVSFAPDASRDFSFSLTAANPLFKVVGGDLKSFSATAGGTFSTDPLPTVNNAVPEASTWSMLLIGFGMMGGTVRARRPKAAQAALV